MLSIREMTVARGGVDVVREVNLDVGGGEIVALLGPSGSGKSSLLLGVAGLIDVASGAVWAGRRDVSQHPPHLRGIGMVFQEYALFPHYDVLRNVRYGLLRTGRDIAAREAHAKAWLDRVGLPPSIYAHRDVATLSGGQRQRVALARALAPEPPVLLLDEPFGALDRQLREELLGECVDLIRRPDGPAAVVVTHDRDEALSMGDRVGVLRDGVLVQLDTPDQLWSTPVDAWTARFLGHPNVVDAPDAAQLGMGAMAAIIPPGSIELMDSDPYSPVGSVTNAVVASTVWRGGRRLATVVVGELELRADVTGQGVRPGDGYAVRIHERDVVRLDRP